MILLVEKKINKAWPGGSDFWISAVVFKGGKAIAAGSRRTAISRKMSSCFLPMSLSAAIACACLLVFSTSSSTSGKAARSRRKALAFSSKAA